MIRAEETRAWTHVKVAAETDVRLAADGSDVLNVVDDSSDRCVVGIDKHREEYTETDRE